MTGDYVYKVTCGSCIYSYCQPNQPTHYHLPEAIIHHMTGASLTSRALLCVPHFSSCEMLETVYSGKHERNYVFASRLV